MKQQRLGFGLLPSLVQQYSGHWHCYVKDHEVFTWVGIGLTAQAAYDAWARATDTRGVWLPKHMRAGADIRANPAVAHMPSMRTNAGQNR